VKTFAWFVRGEKHRDLCQVSIAAVRKVEKRCEIVVATDEPELTVPGATMVRFAPGLPMMVANLEGQLAVMHGRLSQIVFLDTDVLLLKPFPEQRAEALVVTWRDTVGGKIEDVPGGVADAMPYNYGVLSVVPGLRTLEAFVWMRERVRKLTPHLQVWWGNQIALASLAGPRPAAGEVTEERTIPWKMTHPGLPLTVRKLQGSVWNYTLKDPEEDVSMRGAIHFKGHTRGWMKPVCDRLGLPWFGEEPPAKKAPHVILPPHLQAITSQLGRSA
jgi:hypothetical protein